MPEYVFERRHSVSALPETLRYEISPSLSGISSDTRVLAVEGIPSAALRKLSALSGLSEDWDGYGATTPAPKAIEKAKSLLYTLHQLGQPIYDLGAGPNGDVSVEIRRGGKSVEFILYENKAFFVRLLRPGHTESGPYHHAETYSHIQWLQVE